MAAAAVVSQGVPGGLHYLRKQLVISPRLPHCLHALLILACLKSPSCLGPQGHLNTGGALHQIHTLFLKAAWMQWHWTSSGWLEPNPQKCFRSCESPRALSHALSCVPISNCEQSWSLLVPAGPATNQLSCISGVSPGTVPAQRRLRKKTCCHLSALESPPLCGKLLWTLLRCIALTTLETWAAGDFSSQTQEGRPLPGQKRKSLLQSPEPFPSHPLNCHSWPDFSYCPGADLWWGWLLK